MKVIEYNKSLDNDLEHNVKQLEDFIKGYRESGGNGFVCFYIDRTGSKLHHLFAWKRKMDLAIVGGIELLKKEIIKIIEGINDESHIGR